MPVIPHREILLNFKCLGLLTDFEIVDGWHKTSIFK
jgi:hypothetical protein